MKRLKKWTRNPPIDFRRIKLLNYKNDDEKLNIK